MGFYKKTSDKKSGDGLALTEWNDLSNAVAGYSGLHLALNPNDKVGIGTENPSKLLTVAGSGWDDKDGGDFKIINSGLIAAAITLQSTDDGGQTYSLLSTGSRASPKAGCLGIWHNDKSEYRMVISSNGNVGIGTTSPAEKLEVNGNVKATKFTGDGSGLTNLSVGITGLNLATASGSKVGIGTNSPSKLLTVAGSGWDDKDGGDFKIINSGLIAAAITLQSTDDGGQTYSLLSTGSRASPKAGCLGIWHNDKSEYRMVISSNGNVGIGTTSPAAKLHVEGGAIMPSAGNTENSGIFFPKDPSGGSGDTAWLRYYARTGESMTLELGIQNDGDDHIALMSSGNVGIGTNNPSKAKLEVAGSIMEKMDVINCKGRGDWNAQNHPIMLYFKEKLAGKPVG